MKYLLIIILIVIMSLSLFAKDKELSNGLGFAAGFISGSGFSYKHDFGKTAYQITLGVLATNEKNYDNCADYKEENSLIYDEYYTPDTTSTFDYSCDKNHIWGNIGFQYLYKLHRAKNSSFYLLTGVSGYFTSATSDNQKYKYVIDDSTHYHQELVGNTYSSTKNTLHINTGVGLGIEYKITKNIRTSFELPLILSFNDDKNLNLRMFIPQVSLIYFFK